MKHDRIAAGGQALPSAQENPPLATAGAVVIQQIQPAPLAYSEVNQTFVETEEWRGFLRALNVPFTTPRRGLNVVLASDLERTLRARASSLPKAIRKRIKADKTTRPATFESALDAIGMRVVK